MGVKKIYLVRHGQTEFNRKGILQGSGVDSSLNETGQAQAKAFHEAYQSIDPDVVLTSALKRTHESVNGFISSGIKHEIHPELNEVSWGTQDGTPITENSDYWKVIKRWSEGETSLRACDGDTPEELFERQKSIIERIKNGDEDVLLICMHGRAMRILLCNFMELPVFEMDRFKHHNLGLYVIEFDGDSFNITVHNDTAHLEG